MSIERVKTTTPTRPTLYPSPDIFTRLENTGVFKGSKHGRPNHVLLNEVSRVTALYRVFTLY